MPKPTTTWHPVEIGAVVGGSVAGYQLLMGASDVSAVAIPAGASALVSGGVHFLKDRIVQLLFPKPDSWLNQTLLSAPMGIAGAITKPLTGVDAAKQLDSLVKLTLGIGQAAAVGTIMIQAMGRTDPVIGLIAGTTTGLVLIFVDDPQVVKPWDGEKVKKDIKNLARKAQRAASGLDAMLAGDPPGTRETGRKAPVRTTVDRGLGTVYTGYQIATSKSTGDVGTDLVRDGVLAIKNQPPISPKPATPASIATAAAAGTVVAGPLGTVVGAGLAISAPVIAKPLNSIKAVATRVKIKQITPKNVASFFSNKKLRQSLGFKLF